MGVTLGAWKNRCAAATVFTLMMSVLSWDSPSWAAQKPPARTSRNLETAIQAEANAVNRYQLFARKADQEGDAQVAKLFRAAAEAESIHRENHQLALLAMGGRPVQVKLEPVQVRSTRENLEVPVRGEAQEQSQMYPRLIREAQLDHEPQAVRSFVFARDTEAEHEKLFKRALDQLGHNPAEDYYVSKVSGYTVAVPEGHPVAQVQKPEYVKVS